MERDDDPGNVLDDVAQIHPALDRLRQLLTSATILDLKATADGYWTDPPGGAHRPDEADRPSSSRDPA